ncbi:YheT family hydrolase [Marinicella rhabdoformis]|uniref:YheT family hydrolase n=1 Tax=Marinicella rhabdoformis TaxID=2580566 RepID=UPI0012AEB545|nr:alpha/beta fold hydrolase [Marinicella rhabdoformis]
MIICQPPIRPKNPHLQSFLASSRLRLKRLTQNPPFQAAANEVKITTPLADLQGIHSPQAESNHLVVLIHGWEGSAQSTYIQLLADSLYNAGHAVFRLNMRDHGDSHSWNEPLFHSCRLDEMLAALDWIAENNPNHKLSLCGFSLGGNFALRMAAQTTQNLHKVIAVSPPINPKNSMQAIQDLQSYQKYFLKKWRRSLAIKQDYFPHLFEGHNWKEEQSLAALTAQFVEKHTEFNHVNDYFDGYTITPKVIRKLKTQAQIITSWDDPVIPVKDLSTIDRLPQLKCITTAHGGHCGFVQGLSMRSWVEQHIVNEITNEST